jgi:predicted alpha/beta-fold hydrolase
MNIEFIKWANTFTKKFKPNLLLPGLYMKLALVLRKKEPANKDYFREIFVFEEDGGHIALDYYKKAWELILVEKGIAVNDSNRNSSSPRKHSSDSSPC